MSSGASAGALGVDHSRHGDEERVGVGEKNATRGHRTWRSCDEARIFAVASDAERARHDFADDSRDVIAILVVVHSVRRFGVLDDEIDDLAGRLETTSESPTGTPNSSSMAAKNSSSAQLIGSRH